MLDLRGVPCPMSFIRAKLSLERLSVGDRLEIWLDLGEPAEQVPQSLRMDGYCIHHIEMGEAFCALTVERR
ncbi:MAG: sulfurtransferase TusA family protein [Oscillatoriales cyanobacterium SM2_2_1]|nr:sulfurtransferase TusA family protein [Oscillatoriales cyanobacterium SM2_2_1]